MFSVMGPGQIISMLVTVAVVVGLGVIAYRRFGARK